MCNSSQHCALQSMSKNGSSLTSSFHMKISIYIDKPGIYTTKPNTMVKISLNTNTISLSNLIVNWKMTVVIMPTKIPYNT